MVAAVITIMVLALLGVMAYALRLFRIERIDDEPVEQEPPQEESAETDKYAGDGKADIDSMVELHNYFNDGNDEEKASGEEEEAPGVYDTLTEFKTGRGFLLDCKKQLEAARDEGHVFCAACIDFDRFSYINSLKGFATGDYILTNTALELRAIFPENAMITRISCDHFAVLFPLVDIGLFDVYSDQIKRMSEKLRTDISAKAGLRACLGFAVTKSEADYDVSILLHKANIARHCVKITKAEKYEIYDDYMIASNFYGESLLDSYNECQYADDIAIYYAPLSDLNTSRITGCKTLVRWACEENRGPLSDDAQIPTNNAKVIYQTCRAMSRWRKAGRDAVSVLVQIPPLILFQTGIDEFLGKCLMEFQLEPHMFIAGIDASVIRLDWSMCAKQVKKLRDLGAGVCVSGVDTGYRHFEFLSGMDVDYICLHKGFAHGAEIQPDKLEKCKKTTHAIQELGAAAIFEGVNNPDLAEALRKVGAKAVLGRYSGTPALCDDFARDLPEYVERLKPGGETVILDERALQRGDFNLY